MEKLQVVLKTVFEELDGAAVPDDRRLGDIPGWDSMRAVNLLLELESAFKVRLSGVVLLAEERVAEVGQMLRQKGATL